jgi:parvulin-like peptidyl-prolyl isomerase
MNKVISQKLKVKSAIQKSKFLLFTCTFAFCLLPFALNCFAQDKIIAIVNNDVITQKDLNEFLGFARMQLSRELSGKALEERIQSMKNDLLNKLIEDRLIIQEAKKILEEAEKKKDAYALARLQVDENRVKARIDEIKKKYPSEEAFRDALASQGLTTADITAKMKDQALMYNVVELKIKSNVAVNPSEVTDFYNKNADQFVIPSQREFEYVKTSNQKLAQQIVEALRKAEDFKVLADKNSLSLDTLSASQGGELNKEVEDILFKLQVKEASPTVEIGNDFYVFKLNNIVPARRQNLGDVQEIIYRFLFEKKMQEELSQWLDELKKRAYVKITQS